MCRRLIVLVALFFSAVSAGCFPDPMSGRDDADAAAPECMGDEGCDHLDGVCVAGRCDDGECRAEPLDDTPCDDGLRCTTDDRCHQGACQGAPRDCHDDAECTVDSCDEATGRCLHDASACECDEDSDCDDGDPCDGVEICDRDGQCQPGIPVSCPPSTDECLVNVCQPATGTCAPVATNEGGPCDDGLFCTTRDRCHSGTCGGDAADCDDGLSCTVNACGEAQGGCYVSSDTCECADDDDCDDGDPCNGVETCNLTELSCQPGTAVEDDTPCADGLICTAGDVCVGGVCAGTPLDCEDGLSCTENVCSEETGACVIISNTCACQSNGQCNNGNPCDGVETCGNDGQCQPGIPVSCPPSADECLVNVCQQVTGTCAPVATNHGGPCDDGDACTATDVCRAGQCVGSGLPDDSAGDWTVVSASPNGVSVYDVAPDGAGGLWALLGYGDSLRLGPTDGGGELQLDNNSTTWPRAFAVAHYSADGTLTNLRRVARSRDRILGGQIAASGDGGFTIGWRYLQAQDQLGAGAASVTLVDGTLSRYNDAVVAHYTAAGTYGWHRVARNAASPRLDSTPTGTALLTASHSSTSPLKLEVPGQATTVISEPGVSIVEYGVTGGIVRAARVLKGADDANGSCSVTVEGRVLCRGSFHSGSPAVGLELASGAGGSLYRQGGYDGFIALDAPAGGARWLRGVGTAGEDETTSCAVVDDRIACLAVVGFEMSTDDDATAVVYDPSGALHGFPPIHANAKAPAVLLTLVDLDGQLVAGVRHEALDWPTFAGATELMATDSSLFAYGGGRTGHRWWGSTPLPTSTKARSGLVAEIDVDDGQLLWATKAGESDTSLWPKLLAPTTSGPGLTLAGFTKGAYTIGGLSGTADHGQLFLTRLNSAGGAACP